MPTPSDLAPPPPPPQGSLLSAVHDATTEIDQLLARVACSVVQAGCWLPVPPHWSLDVPGRPNYTLWLCTGGWAEYRLGGRSHELAAGGVILAPPGLRRQGRHHPANPLHLYTVHLNARLYGVLDLPAVCGFPEALRPRPAAFQRMAALAREIVEELAGSAAGYALAANGACAQLIALYWREALAQGIAGRRPGATAGARPGDLARLASVFRAIEERYAEPLSLRDLAAAVHLHPAYLSTVFRKAVGLPPLRYLSRYRLDRVRELLLSTDLPVSAIAQRTGFPDPTYINRVFRRAEGCTPTQYRASKENPTFA